MLLRVLVLLTGYDNLNIIPCRCLSYFALVPGQLRHKLLSFLHMLCALLLAEWLTIDSQLVWPRWVVLRYDGGDVTRS